jgi:SAM-dependent methyltransferase
MQMRKVKAGKTIEDFGNQWQIHGNLRQDHWTSDLMFRDHFPSDFNFSILVGKRVLEVGSGSGRILRMLSRYSPKELIGIEPSSGFAKLVENTNDIKNLKLINISGSDFKVDNLDVIISLGVIHHIPNASEVIQNIYHSLAEDGTFIMWVYGRENNQPYVFFQENARKLTKMLPDNVLNQISLGVSFLFDLYGVLSKILFYNKLPLTGYHQNVFSKCGRREKKYIIFDQLNPTYSKYYREAEVIYLLESNGFQEVKTFHRHGYSWTAVARKKADIT